MRDNPKFQDIVRSDLEALIEQVELDLDESMWKNLLVQSVLGHAHKGQGMFSTTYPQATVSDVIVAAGLDLDKTKHDRQKVITEVYQWVDLALEMELEKPFLASNDRPLLGVGFLEGFHAHPEYALRGMVLAGYMDNFAARTEAVNHFRTATNSERLLIGGGETYLVDLGVLKSLGMDFSSLANFNHDERKIDSFKNTNLIVDQPGENIEVAYVRRRGGPGISDDLAFIIMGFMYSDEGWYKASSVMLGGFVNDAIDTYDKCVLSPISGGFDEALAEHIQGSWQKKKGRPLVSQEEIRTLIYYSAKGNTPKVPVSSSHRRLIQFNNEKKYRPTILAHLAYLKGEPVGNFEIGYDRMKSRIFYDSAGQRVEHMLKNRVL